MLTSVVVKFNDTSDHLLYLCPTTLLSLASLLAEDAMIVEDNESLERHCREKARFFQMLPVVGPYHRSSTKVANDSNTSK